MDQPGSADILLFENFRLDRGKGVLYRLGQGAPVVLGSRALNLLGLLAARQGEAVSKDEIMGTVWPGRAVEESNLNVQISKLRHILDQDREQDSCIQTLPGRGYCFVAPVTRPGDDAHSTVPIISGSAIPPRPPLSIVVLPFTDFGKELSQQYFVDGITEDLTTDLSRFADMFVISRNTAFTYRDKPADTKQIGRELGVRYVLEGSIRRSDKQIRVNVQLIDAEADTHVWAERFDRPLSDLFALQDEITAAIAGAIEPQLLQSERNRIASRPPQSEDAYELYQHGMWHLYRYSKESNIEAQALFRRALAINPRYPQATAFLAITVCNQAYLGGADDAQRNFVEAYQLGDRAVTLDPSHPAAHFALGLVCMWTSRAGRAIEAFQEAIRLNPNYSAAQVLLGQMYLYDGRAEEAVMLIEKGLRRSPRDPRLFMWLSALAGARYQLRQYEAAVDAARRAWTLGRDWPASLRYIAAGLARLERPAEAAEAIEELRSRNQSIAFIEGNMRRLYRDESAVTHIIDGLREAGLQ